MLLERYDFDQTLNDSSDSDASQRDFVETYTKRGNDCQGSLDPHICCLYRKKLSSRQVLREHLQKVHMKKSEFSCDLCRKSFSTRSSMLNHMPVHCEKRFQCNICDYKTSIRCNLKKHKLIHTAKTECRICNKQVFSMASHMKSHRPKVSCSICKKMITRDYIKKHTKTHKNKNCELCAQIFGSKADLRR